MLLIRKLLSSKVFFSKLFFKKVHHIKGWNVDNSICFQVFIFWWSNWPKFSSNAPSPFRQIIFQSKSSSNQTSNHNICFQVFIICRTNWFYQRFIAFQPEIISCSLLQIIFFKSSSKRTFNSFYKRFIISKVEMWIITSAFMQVFIVCWSYYSQGILVSSTIYCFLS